MEASGMGRYLQLLWEKVGGFIGLLITLFKIAVVVAIIQGFLTGDWMNLVKCGILVVLAVLISRGISNHAAFLAASFPFGKEIVNLLHLDPGLVDKGNRIREKSKGGFVDLFDINPAGDDHEE
jgi:hypothetical protein